MNKIIFICLALLLCSSVYAQSDDFGVWTTIEAKKKLLPGLEASIEGDFRTRDDLGTVDRWSGAAGLSYRIWSFLKVGGDYTFIRFNHTKRGWETGHRYNLYATGSYRWNRLNFSLRERYQQTYRKDVSVTAKRANPKKILRSRLQMSYDIKKSAFEPYASMELFHKLNDPQNNGLDKIRYTFGTEYKLNKKNAFQIYYRYQTVRDDEDPNLHVLGLGYTIKL